MSEKLDLTIKSNIAKYIHNCAETEKQIYTLNKTRDRCIANANHILKTAKNNLSISENKLIKANNSVKKGNAILETNKKYNKPHIFYLLKKSLLDIYELVKKFLDFISDFYFWAFFFLFGSLGLLGYGLYILLNKKIGIGTGIILSIIIIFFIIFIIFFIKNYKKERKHNIETDALVEAVLETSKNESFDYKNQVIENKYKLRIAKEQAKILNEQAKICEESAIELNNILQDSYAKTDIIKKDFRFIDCVLVLDFAFRNDLVDTVREGIFYYENKAFQNGVIRGIDKICARINELNVSVQGLRFELQDMNDNITNLSNNSINFANEITNSFNKSISLQEESISINREQLNSSLATQYAIESIKNSRVFDHYY
ncbi:MAG: hypothetical protein IJX17_06790 [Clostridia bacterium]|nr:hypothetical protein [Clostridia bacterium]